MDHDTWVWKENVVQELLDNEVEIHQKMLTRYGCAVKRYWGGEPQPYHYRVTTSFDKPKDESFGTIVVEQKVEYWTEEGWKPVDSSD